MQLTIPRGDLAGAIDALKSVVAKNSTLPILNCVLLHANGHGMLELTGTNLERETIVSAKAEIGAPGTYAVPGHILTSVVRSLPKDASVSLSLNAERSRIDLVAGRSRYQLGFLPADDFPQLAPDDTTWTFDLELNARAFAKLCDVNFACNENMKDRIFLTGVFMRTPEDDARLIRATATNGHQLAAMEVVAPEGAAAMPGVIVPGVACADMASALSDAAAEDVVRVRLNSGRMALDYQSRRTVTRLVDGKFPDTSRLMPSPGQPHRAEFRRSDMIDTLSRVCSVSSGAKLRIATFVFADDEILISAKHDDGHAADDASAATCVGGAHRFNVNAAYMLEHLNKMRGVKVRLEHENRRMPIMLYDDGVLEARHLIMPTELPGDSGA